VPCRRPPGRTCALSKCLAVLYNEDLRADRGNAYGVVNEVHGYWQGQACDHASQSSLCPTDQALPLTQGLGRDMDTSIMLTDILVSILYACTVVWIRMANLFQVVVIQYQYCRDAIVYPDV